MRLLYKHLAWLGHKAIGLRAYLDLLMKDITDFHTQTQMDKLKAQLRFNADFARQTPGENPITKTTLTHFEGIANYAHSGFTNGILEGMNAKNQLIKRVARGFRYTHNFKKMIRFVFSQYQHPAFS
jgi:transposase